MFILTLHLIVLHFICVRIAHHFKLKVCQSLSMNLENFISLLLEPVSKCGSFVESVDSFPTVLDRQND